MSEKIGEKMAQLGAQLKAADGFDERARGWMLDYIEASEARATVLYVEREEARAAQREAEIRAAAMQDEMFMGRIERADLEKASAAERAALIDERVKLATDRAKLAAERSALIDERGALIDERAELEAEREELEGEGDAAKMRAAALEVERDAAQTRAAALELELERAHTRAAELADELEAARSGAACRQPWLNLEGGPAERARAALQDAIYHVQRDGEMGLARIYARHAAELVEGGQTRLQLGSARELEIVGRRLRDIIGQLDVIINGEGVPKAIREHAALIKLDAEKARAELGGEDWRNG